MTPVAMKTNMHKTDQLYGLRAFAIAMVVASHAQLLSQGGLGNCMMFCLSGFLAVSPFSKDGVHFRSAADVGRYYLRKIKNILPAYYFLLVVIKLLTDGNVFTWTGLAKCMLFIDCPGQFWFLQMIMIMYLITPPIIMLFDLCARRSEEGPKRRMTYVMLSVVLAVISGVFLTRINFHIYGNGTYQPLRLYMYAVGMAFGYYYLYLKETGALEGPVSKAAKRGMGAAAIALFILAFASSCRFLAYISPSLADYYVGWRQPVLCTALTGVLALLLLAHGDGLLARFFSTRPLVALGKVSYEIYIVHYFLIEHLRLSVFPYKNFITLYAVSACIAFVTGTYVVPWLLGLIQGAAAGSKRDRREI